MYYKLCIKFIIYICIYILHIAFTLAFTLLSEIMLTNKSKNRFKFHKTQYKCQT